MVKRDAIEDYAVRAQKATGAQAFGPFNFSLTGKNQRSLLNGALALDR